MAPALELTLPPAGVRLATRGGATAVRLRRFASGFPDAELGRITGASEAELRVRSAGAELPWHLRISPDAETTACGPR